MPQFRVTDAPAQSDAHRQRLDELHASGLLDSPAEEEFDRVTRLARQMLGVEAAMVSLVDDDRQFFKSQEGLSGELAERRGAPLTHSLCKYAVASGEPLVASDLTTSPLLRESPAIADDGLIAYAGHPLETSNGHVLGTLCVIEKKPREWSPGELQLLEELTGFVVREIEYRRQRMELAQIQSLTERMVGPLEQLGDSVRSAAELAATPHDPRLPRMTSSARARLSTVNAVFGDLVHVAMESRHRGSRPVEAVDLSERLLAAVHFASAAARAEDIDVSVDDAPVRVWLDRSAIDKALTLLVMTALDHLGEGERAMIALHSGTSEARLEVNSPGHRMPVAELLRVVARLSPAEEGEEPEEATVASTGRVTTVRVASVTASTSPQGTTFVVRYPTVQASSEPARGDKQSLEHLHGAVDA